MEFLVHTLYLRNGSVFYTTKQILYRTRAAANDYFYFD